jgi:hypothetical protein
MSTTTTLGLRADPLVAVPVVFSSTAVAYAMFETVIFFSFIDASKEDLPATNKVVRIWWSKFLAPGIALAGATILPGALTAAYASRLSPAGSLQQKLLIAGSAFALGHFAFVGPVAKTIESICDEEVEKQGKTIHYVKLWLKIHSWRTMFTDLASLVCFSWAAFGC